MTALVMPSMNRKERRRLAARLREREPGRKARFDDFRAAIRPGRCLISAELLPYTLARVHPLFGGAVRGAMTAAYGAAHGVAPPGTTAFDQCFGCLAAWTPDGPPALVALLRFTNPPESGGVAFLCEACAAGAAPAPERRVLDGLRRDLLADAEPMPTSALSREGGTA